MISADQVVEPGGWVKIRTKEITTVNGSYHS